MNVWNQQKLSHFQILSRVPQKSSKWFTQTLSPRNTATSSWRRPEPSSFTCGCPSRSAKPGRSTTSSTRRCTLTRSRPSTVFSALTKTPWKEFLSTSVSFWPEELDIRWWVCHFYIWVIWTKMQNFMIIIEIQVWPNIKQGKFYIEKE